MVLESAHYNMTLLKSCDKGNPQAGAIIATCLRVIHIPDIGAIELLIFR